MKCENNVRWNAPLLELIALLVEGLDQLGVDDVLDLGKLHTASTPETAIEVRLGDTEVHLHLIIRVEGA